VALSSDENAKHKTCYHCGKEEHLSENCPQPQKA